MNEKDVLMRFLLFVKCWKYIEAPLNMPPSIVNDHDATPAVLGVTDYKVVNYWKLTTFVSNGGT